MDIGFIKSEHDLNVFLDELEAKFEDLWSQLGRIHLNQFIDKKPNPEAARIEREMAELSLNPTHQEIIAAWQDKIEDPVLARRVEVWAQNLLLEQVGAQDEIMNLRREVANKIIGHKYLVNGGRISLGSVRGIVRSNPNREMRKAAWESYSELSELIADDLLKLIKLRNKAAQNLGYATYVDMVLEMNGMKPTDVETILNELTQATQCRYQEIIEEGAAKLEIDNIEAWDIQYILEQQGGVPTHHFPKDSLVDAINAWATRMGISLQDLGIEPLFIDIPYNGLCMPIDRKTVKILCNPEDGFSYYGTLFHEMGHALHAALKTIEAFVFHSESSIITEGIAEIFGYIPDDIEWLRGFGLSEDIAKQALDSAIGPKFHYLRQRTAFALFEYEMYRNPEQDLNDLLASVEAKVLGGALNSTPRWAANAWYVDYPVYWQNYVLADVIASQVHHHLRGNVGSLTRDKAAFDYVVKQYIAQGSLVPWMQKIEEGTGKKLSADALIEDLTK